MGTGKKERKVKGMKKSIAIAVTIIFTLGTLFSTAVFSFGMVNDRENKYDTEDKTKYTREHNNFTEDEDSQTSNENEYNEYDQKIENKKRTVTADTSWFDYKNPKKKYNITSEAQLMGLASLVNQEQAMWKPTRLETFEGVTFTLIRDIELTQPWTPIGSGEAICFKGVFNGNGHSIRNVKIVSTSANTGFFGYLKGEVKDLEVQGSIVSKSGNCGGIAGMLDASGKIKNCTSNMDIKAKIKTGGIVGDSNGTIEGCINLGRVSGTYKVGGIVGENWGGVIEECGNKGSISSSVRGVATFGTGGVAGRSVASTALVSDCYNTGNINSATEATGGVVGYTNAKNSTVINSYNTGNIKIRDINKEKKFAKAWAGGVIGIVGTDGVVISNCYNSGEITGADKTGGVIGQYIASEKDDPAGYIENNYYLNDICDKGIGEDNKGRTVTEITNCIMGASGGSLSSMISALGISYMKDSSGIYGNNGYPVLRWQEPISAENKAYLEGVSKEVQIKLDNYLINNTEDTSKGDTVISIFNPDNYLTDTLLMYDEAINKEKKDNKNEKEEQ